MEILWLMNLRILLFVSIIKKGKFFNFKELKTCVAHKHFQVFDDRRAFVGYFSTPARAHSEWSFLDIICETKRNLQRAKCKVLSSPNYAFKLHYREGQLSHLVSAQSICFGWFIFRLRTIEYNKYARNLDFTQHYLIQIRSLN